MNYNILIFINSTSWLSLVVIFSIVQLSCDANLEELLPSQVAIHDWKHTDKIKMKILLWSKQWMMEVWSDFLASTNNEFYVLVLIYFC